MTVSRRAQRLVDACLGVPRYQPHELLRWLVCDVLADFGVPQVEHPPDDVLPWLRETAGEYARAVADHPYVDVLGVVYQELGSKGHRRVLGQFFSPESIAALVGALLAGGDECEGRAREGGGLWRACEPACGSGALILGFMQALSERHGSAALEHWSISAIDLDPLCSSICAAQVLSNLLIHRGTLGELVVYRGKALGLPSGLRVVVHTTIADLTPNCVLSALHPSRVAALRAAASASHPTPSDLHVPSIQPDGQHGAAVELVMKTVTAESTREFDLFAE